MERTPDKIYEIYSIQPHGKYDCIQTVKDCYGLEAVQNYMEILKKKKAVVKEVTVKRR